MEDGGWRSGTECFSHKRTQRTQRRKMGDEGQKSESRGQRSEVGGKRRQRRGGIGTAKYTEYMKGKSNSTSFRKFGGAAVGARRTQPRSRNERASHGGGSF